MLFTQIIIFKHSMECKGGGMAECPKCGSRWYEKFEGVTIPQRERGLFGVSMARVPVNIQNGHPLLALVPFAVWGAKALFSTVYRCKKCSREWRVWFE